MVSSYVKVMVKKGIGWTDVYHRDSRSKTVLGEGFEFIWKCRNNTRTWREALKLQNISLPAVLDVSSDFSTTVQIKRYK